MKSGATYLLILDYGGDIAAVEKVIFTFVGAGALARNYPTDISFSDGKFVVPFTQSDTLLLAGENGHLVETEVQINFKNHAVAKQSYPAFYIERTFATEIVPGNSPSGDIVLDHLSFKVDGSVIVAKVEGDVKPELIASMVDDYMKAHPIESGITEDECNSLIFDYVTAHKEELKGDTGETGPQGIQGPKGDTGEVGPRGPQGEPGVNGKDGKDGVDGQKGDKGETGNVGPQGPKGDTGETGPQGPQGIPGEKGADGKNGVDGENYSIAVTTDIPDELLPNIFYRFGEQSDVFIAIANTEDESHLNEYMFEFVSGEIATDFSYDVGSITFVEEPVIEANKLYQGSIVNGVGLLVGVDYE